MPMRHKNSRPAKQQGGNSTEYFVFSTVYLTGGTSDWYDLDFLYIKMHPDFRAFSIYSNAVGFQNSYLDFFSSDAFDARREYITSFYRSANDNLERPYIYFTEQAAQSFVLSASSTIHLLLREKYCECWHLFPAPA